MFSAITQGLTSVCAKAAMLTAPAPTTSGSGGFDIAHFLSNTAGYAKNIGNYVIMLAGVVLIIIGIIQIVKGLAGGGRGQVNWVMAIACLLVGGLLTFGGWNMAASIAKIGQGTVEEINGNDTYGQEFRDATDGGGIAAP